MYRILVWCSYDNHITSRLVIHVRISATSGATIDIRHSNYNRSFIVFNHRHHPPSSLRVYGCDHSYPHTRNSNSQTPQLLGTTGSILLSAPVPFGTLRLLPLSQWLSLPVPDPPQRDSLSRAASTRTSLLHRCLYAVRLHHIASLSHIHVWSHDMIYPTHRVCMSLHASSVAPPSVCVIA